jgi:hypothetical protein
MVYFCWNPNEIQDGGEENTMTDNPRRDRLLWALLIGSALLAAAGVLLVKLGH